MTNLQISIVLLGSKWDVTQVLTEVARTVGVSSSVRETPCSVKVTASLVSPK